MDLAERFDTLETLIKAEKAPGWLPNLKFTVAQVADVVGLSHHTVRQHIRHGNIVCDKDGATYWFTYSQLKAAIRRLGSN